MTLGIAGENLIKSYEGFPSDSAGNAVGYIDAVGVPTIGWGHTGTVDGVAVYKGMVISKAKAQELFKSDVAWAENAVNKLVTVTLTQAQFDALVSFCFNVGQSSFASSTLLKKLNGGDYAGAIRELYYTDATGEHGWIKGRVGGVLTVLKGLVDRRKAEQALYNKDSYPEGTPDPEDPTVIIPPPPTPEPDPEDPPPYSPPTMGEVYKAVAGTSYNLAQLSDNALLYLKTLSFGDVVHMKYTFKRNKQIIGTDFFGNRLTFDNKAYTIKSVTKKGFVVIGFANSFCLKTINPTNII